MYFFRLPGQGRLVKEPVFELIPECKDPGEKESRQRKEAWTMELERCRGAWILEAKGENGGGKEGGQEGRQGQIMQDLLDWKEEFGFCVTCHGKPLQRFEARCDFI